MAGASKKRTSRKRNVKRKQSVAKSVANSDSSLVSSSSLSAGRNLHVECSQKTATGTLTQDVMIQRGSIRATTFTDTMKNLHKFSVSVLPTRKNNLRQIPVKQYFPVQKRKSSPQSQDKIPLQIPILNFSAAQVSVSEEANTMDDEDMSPTVLPEDCPDSAANNTIEISDSDSSDDVVFEKEVITIWEPESEVDSEVEVD